MDQVCIVPSKCEMASNNNQGIKHKKKALYNIESSTIFEKCYTVSNKDNQKHKVSELNAIESSPKVDGSSVSSNKHKKKQNNKLNELQALEKGTVSNKYNIIFSNDKKEIITGKKHLLNTSDISSVVSNYDKPSNKHKTKRKKERLNSIDFYSSFNEHTKNKKDNFEINDAAVKKPNEHKKKRKRNKDAELNSPEFHASFSESCTASSSNIEKLKSNLCPPTFTDDDLISDLKHKKRKTNSINSEACGINDEHSISPGKHKINTESELFIHETCSDFNEIEKCNKKSKKKHKNNKESDLSASKTSSVFNNLDVLEQTTILSKNNSNSLSPELSIVFDKSEVNSSNKHKHKKKDKKNRDLKTIATDKLYRIKPKIKHRTVNENAIYDNHTVQPYNKSNTKTDINIIKTNSSKQKKHKKNKEKDLNATFSEQDGLQHLQKHSAHKSRSVLDDPNVSSNEHDVYGNPKTTFIESEGNSNAHKSYKENSLNTVISSTPLFKSENIHKKLQFDKSEIKSKHKKQDAPDHIKEHRGNNFSWSSDSHLVFDQPKVNSDNQYKHRKKHKNKDLNIAGISIPPKQSEILSKEQQILLHVAETNNVRHEINSGINQKKCMNSDKNNVNIAETCPAFDQHNVTSTKHKKKRKKDNFNGSKDCNELECEITSNDICINKESYSSVLDEYPVKNDVKHKEKKKKVKEIKKSDLNYAKIESHLNNSESNFSNKNYGEYDDCRVVSDGCNEIIPSNKHKKKQKRDKGTRLFQDCVDLDSLGLNFAATINHNNNKEYRKEQEEINILNTCTFNNQQYADEDIAAIDSTLIDDHNFDEFFNAGITFNNDHIPDQEISDSVHKALLVGQECLANQTDKGKNNVSETERTFDTGADDYYFPLFLDCFEDPVDFEISPLHKYETVRNLSQTQKEDIESEGIFIRKGRFTATEDEIIKKNFDDFAERYGVYDPVQLFGIGREVKDKELLNFIKAKHFYLRIAKDLNDRTLYSVYKRARLLLHPFRTESKFTEREITSLKGLRKALTHKWNQIGDVLGKSPASCLQTYRWHDKNIAKGKFTKEEETLLIEAIKNVTGSSDVSYKSVKHISWERVASYVPSRNFNQCRMYWADHLAWKPGSAQKKWDSSCYCKLVNILRNEWKVEDSSMINWDKVHESFEDFAPSPLYVQKKWLYLKSRVPGYKNKNHKKIIKTLCKLYPISTENG